MAENYENPPPILYKYRQLDEFSRRLLKKNELFCASPSSFNDPFDSTIPTRFELGSKLEFTRKYTEILKRNKPELTREQRRRKVREKWKKLTKDPQRIIRDWREREKRATDTFGICCLTTNPHSLLMWSHYADSHKGFVVGFDTKRILKKTIQKHLNFGETIAFFPINYTDEYPLIDPYKEEGWVKEKMTTKSRQWCYEEEYRLIWHKGANKILYLEDAAICEIIIGCRMPEADRKEVIDILENKANQVTIKKAIQSEEAFKLDFREL